MARAAPRPCHPPVYPYYPLTPSPGRTSMCVSGCADAGCDEYKWLDVASVEPKRSVATSCVGRDELRAYLRMVRAAPQPASTRAVHASTEQAPRTVPPLD